MVEYFSSTLSDAIGNLKERKYLRSWIQAACVSRWDHIALHLNEHPLQTFLLTSNMLEASVIAGDLKLIFYPNRFKNVRYYVVTFGLGNYLKHPLSLKSRDWCAVFLYACCQIHSDVMNLLMKFLLLICCMWWNLIQTHRDERSHRWRFRPGHILRCSLDRGRGTVIINHLHTLIMLYM